MKIVTEPTQPRGPLFRDIAGQSFGLLTALYIAPRCTWTHGLALEWVCKCGCGRWTQVSGNSLRQGKAKSCGCNRVRTKHGRLYTREWYSWKTMRRRCLNPNDPSYRHYGGRGITVCAEWADKEHGFERFFEHLGPRPENMTLDRIDNDGNYEPGNVRWATKSQQRRNRREMTHCQNGHDLAVAGVRIDRRGYRRCLICLRARWRGVAQ